MSLGADIPRVEGEAKLRGKLRFVDDLAFEGLLHGGTIRSPAPRGRIKRVVFDPSINWDEFVVFDHRDLPGPNQVSLIENDWRILADDEVRHLHEPVLLIAHPSPAALRAATRAVRVEIEPLPAVTDPEQPLDADHIQHGYDNVLKAIDIKKGTPAAIFAKAPHVIEGVYRTGAQEHLYLETQGVVACPEEEGLTLYGSLQCPYFVLSSLACALGVQPPHVRVVATPPGGAFGGKEDYPSLLALHAALLAGKAQAPVKIVYARPEDMAATTKRHPSVVRHRTAVDADGRFLAAEVDVLLDGGAYVTLSPVVLSRGCIHATGPYAIDHVHIHGEARLTNSPPYGAFRGFGAPQTLFAMERHVDVMAQHLGIDPVELRRRNLLRDGQTTATGQVVRDHVDLPALMDQALELAEHTKRRKQHARFNQSHPYLRRGLGLSCFFHGAGFTGSGETMLASEVWVDGCPDGTVELLTAQTDMGQGANTVLAQVVASKLDVPFEQVRVAAPDTARVPNSGPTVASRTAMVVGKLLERACEALARKVSPAGGRLSGADLQEAIRRWHRDNPCGTLRGQAKYQAPPEISWNEQTYEGDAYSTYAWATYVAEVEVDLRTFAVRVTDFVALQDVGRVLNPTLAAGQIQGGVAQGIGWALMEDVQLEDGAMRNNNLANYIIPTSCDLPPIRVAFGQQPAPYGPGGAKGIGELPMNGPAPAIVNAVRDAIGINVDAVPLTPEILMAHMESRSDA